LLLGPLQAQFKILSFRHDPIIALASGASAHSSKMLH
jgi:hypothetical protein